MREVPLPECVRAVEEALLRLGIEAHHPEPLLLGPLEGAGEVHDPRHGQVLQRAGAGPRHDAAEGRRVALREDRPRRPGALGGAEQRPDVLGILDPVEDHEPAPPRGPGVEELVEADLGKRPGLEHQALGPRPGRQVVQGLRGDLFDGDAGTAGQRAHLAELGPPQAGANQEPHQGAAARPERLAHRVEADDGLRVHGRSMQGSALSRSAGRLGGARGSRAARPESSIRGWFLSSNSR